MSLKADRLFISFRTYCGDCYPCLAIVYYGIGCVNGKCNLKRLYATIRPFIRGLYADTALIFTVKSVMGKPAITPDSKSNLELVNSPAGGGLFGGFTCSGVIGGNRRSHHHGIVVPSIAASIAVTILPTTICLSLLSTPFLARLDILFSVMKCCLSPNISYSPQYDEQPAESFTKLFRKLFFRDRYCIYHILLINQLFFTSIR